MKASTNPLLFLLFLTACGTTTVTAPSVATWEDISPAPAPVAASVDTADVELRPSVADLLETGRAAGFRARSVTLQAGRIAATVSQAPSADVIAVADAISAVHVDAPTCGGYCTSSRRDRSNIPDYSSFVVTDKEALVAAFAIVEASEMYDVPLPSMLATAYQESHFRRLAIGGGTECGMFQQSSHYADWESEHVESREPITELDGYDGEEAICAYFHDPTNSAWQFAVQYHRLYERWGDNWPRHYNGGADKIRYQEDHYRYLGILERALEERLESPNEVATAE